MALTSNVPAIQWAQSGVVLPTDAAIVAGVQADYNLAFGTTLSPNLDTPQGQLASSQSAIVADKNQQIARLINQFDPRFADGIWQDALARIYLLTRKPAIATAVECLLNGLSGVVIPSGALAQDAAGNTYALSGTVTIGASGFVTAQFQNIVNGSIPCEANTLTKITQVISGWDTINNSSAGVIGSPVESRAEFEFRRKNSVSINSHGTVGSIYSNVFAVTNVIDVFVIENASGTPLNYGATNYPLAPHSVYVAAVGGADADVAAAIWLKKSLGCDYNGNTSVTVYDKSGYAFPFPAYVVKFERPSSLAIKFDVQIVNNSLLSGDIVALVKAAIVGRFNGTVSATRERIGSTIYASNYYGVIATLSPAMSIISVLVGTTSPTLLSVGVGIDQSPTITDADISVTLV